MQYLHGNTSVTTQTSVIIREIKYSPVSFQTIRCYIVKYPFNLGIPIIILSELLVC